MIPHKLTIQLSTLLFTFSLLKFPTEAQKRKAPEGGRIAVVVDERLSALRATPQLSGKLLRRIGRGRLVAIRAVKTGSDGVVFLLVNLSARTHGWIQREAVVSAAHPADDQRLLQLIQRSAEFDRIARCRIFLDQFPRSSLRAEVLSLLGATAEEVAARLSREAARRFNESAGGAPQFSYFLNYTGLDRYNRQGVNFTFDQTSKQFHYDGSAWRELIRHYPRAPQAEDARKRLVQLSPITSKHHR